MTLSSIARAGVIALAFTLGVPALANDFDGAYVGAAFSVDLVQNNYLDKEGSAFIGYNWDFGNGMVVGGEADLTVNPLSIWGTSATTTTLDARFGYLVSDDIMVYGRTGGGYTSALTGSTVWDAGAGAEYMFDNGFTIRGEVDRVDPFEAGMVTQVNGRLGVVMNF